MKKHLLFLLALIPMIVFNACSSANKEDESNVLVGTKWENKTYKSNSENEIESVTTLYFQSSTSMTVFFEGDYDETKGFKTHNSATATYSFDGSVITVKFNDYYVTGVISGENLIMNQTSKNESETFVFKKVN